jgi:signal transduction histidine kinase
VNAIAVLDTVSLAGFVLALVIVMLIRADSTGVCRQLKVPLLIVLALYAFVGASNVAEHAGISASLDAYEDYAEVLFVPLIAYILYSRSTAEQLAAARRAEHAIRSEHDLLMSVVETTPAGILVTDAAGLVSFANDEARRMLDLEGREDGAGLVCRACEDHGVVREGGSLDLAAVATAAPVSALLQTVERPEGTTFLSVSATPLLTSGPGEPRSVLVIEDVTARTSIERELEEYRQNLERVIDRRTSELLEVNQQLTEAGRAREEFLANMSHELRTPLNSIIGFTDIILSGLSGPLSEEQRTQLGMVKESSAELLSLVTDVLDLSRIEQGHSPVNIAPVDVGAHVGRLVESMRALARARGITLVWDCPSVSEVTTDPDKLGQIVRNLVANAIKFTDRGGTVTVRTTLEESCAVVTVSDTGIGIAEADLGRIFEAFQQVESPDRARPQGTGLGLAISRQLCGLLGCDLTVQSTVGHGSTFTLRIPLGAPHTDL